MMSVSLRCTHRRGGVHRFGQLPDADVELPHSVADGDDVDRVADLVHLQHCRPDVLVGWLVEVGRVDEAFMVSTTC